MSNWASSRRRSQLPKDWWRRVQRTKKAAGGRCEAMSQVTDWGKVYDEGTRCVREGTDADHRGDPMDHDDLQWLCGPHHKLKTAQEARAAREAMKPPRRREAHPSGLVWDPRGKEGSHARGQDVRRRRG
ncbi:MAG TPA: hypothetical protein VKZ65_15920 [Glycomyces sp.]|nr:hypothetical protein [Glycomyces sp.]